MKETDIQRQCLEYLKVKGIFHWRANNIPVPGRKFNGMPGLPDIICLINGKFIGIEVKAHKGVQSVDQITFQSNCISNGGVYILVRSLDDLMEALKYYSISRK